MDDARVSVSLRTVWWEESDSGGSVFLLDQSCLPLHEVTLHLQHEREVAEAISHLRVRGAPAIGVTAAFGLALAFERLRAAGMDLSQAEAKGHLSVVSSLLRSTRPTAVNLSWALERMNTCAQTILDTDFSFGRLTSALVTEAQRIAVEDAEACLAMGRLGAELISDGDILLTHCNAGALATSGIGTALAPIYTAAHSGKRLHVYVDETRPVLQGSRLTAWELQRQGIPLTLITDTMAAYFLRKAGIKGIFVGADRIAANGDVANKIGTYGLAVLAAAHNVPLYVVAPCSTIDLSLATGELIPIEQRKPEEVTEIAGQQIAPPGVQVANPAFDVTPYKYISAIVTERGIAHAPFERSLPALFDTNH